MTVKNFNIDFHIDGYTTDGKTKISSFTDWGGGAGGSSVALGNGIFLTASHLFDQIVKGKNTGTLVRFMGRDFTVNGVVATNAKAVNLEGWDSNTSYNTQTFSKDLAELKSSVQVSSSDVSSVIMFADQHAVTRVLTGQTINNSGRISQNSGTFMGVQGSDEFSANLLTHSGDSGGAAAINIAGTQYVAGVLSNGAVDKNDTSVDLPPSYYSYLNPKSFYATMNDVAKGGSQDFSKVAPDLIYGEDDKEYIRGTVRKSDIILNGNSDVILAGGVGDTISTGLGNHDVIFTAAANGGTDNGTTFIIGPGNTTIVGGNANDRLDILADRLWSRTTGTPTAANLKANSDLIQLTGGTGNQPGSTIRDFVEPALGYWQYDSDSPATVAEANSTNPLDRVKGNYDYFVTYDPEKNAAGGTDVTVEFAAVDPSTASNSLLWRGSVVIKNYHAGDFGLKFTVDPSYAENQAGTLSDADYYAAKSKAMAAFQPTAIQSQYANDDTTTNWNGKTTFWAPEKLTDATIKADLTANLTATQGSPGTTTAAASRLVQAMSTFDTGPGVDAYSPHSDAAIAPSQMLAANSASSAFMHQHHA